MKEIEKMFEMLSEKIADRIMPCLTGGGPETRAAKAVREYRKRPSEAGAAEALTALNQLDQNKQAEIRAVARV